MSITLPVLILTGRPAAGKSEVIDYLKSLPVIRRAGDLRLGPFEEIDDFPYIWEKFEEEEIFAKSGKGRLHTDEKLYFKDEWFWTFCIEKMNLAFRKKLAREPGYFDDGNSILIEFARGGKRGIRTALEALAPEILSRAGIVYIQVSYEESVRKNRRRARPGREDSILYHSLPDEKMEFYYRDNDWEDLSGGRSSGVLDVGGIAVPFSVLPNEPEVTDSREKLGPALGATMGRLWEEYLRTR